MEDDESRQTSAVAYRPLLYISYERHNRIAANVATKMTQYLTSFGKFGIYIDIEIGEYEEKYVKIAETMKLCDLVIIIYSDRYQSNIDCQREATLAADQAKKMIFVRGQNSKFKIEDWFYALKGGRFHVDYHVEPDALEKLRAHLFDMFGFDLPRPLSGFEIRKFRPINIQKPVYYYERKSYEEVVLKELKELCEDPLNGSLLICGDGGVGKTTLLERVMSQKSNREYFLEECKIRAAVWLNCFEWQQTGEDFGVKQQRAIVRSLLQKINTRFGSLTRFTRMADFVSFFKELGETAVFILDDVFSEELLQFFRQRFPDSPIIVITRDPVVFTTPLYQKVPLVRQLVRVSELSDNDVIDMLQTTFNLDETLTQKQINNLAQRCCGLPLIASLIAAGLRDPQQSAYHSLVNSNIANFNIGGPYGSVLQLFEFSLNLLADKLRHSYYAFLLFDPAEPVSVVDLAILWGQDPQNTTYTERMCQLIADKSLLRKAANKVKGSNKQPEESCWFIHQMLHEAVLKHAADAFKLATHDHRALSKIRLRIITGRLVPNVKKPPANEFSIKRLVEAVKQRRLPLLSKIIEKIEAPDLAELCRQKTQETGGMTFLHYLYTVNWAINPNQYFGASISYRLIREIIFKLREFKIDFVSVVNQDRDIINRRVEGKPKSMLHQLFGEKDAWRYTPDRNSLIEMLGQSMQKLHEERKWEEAFSLNEVFRKFLDVLNDKDAGAAFDSFINSYDGKALNKHDQGELMLCASRKGCLEVVSKLANMFPFAGKHKSRTGSTPVMYAAANNHTKVVIFLIDRYPDAVLAKDGSGWSALTHAVWNGNLEIVDLLAVKMTEVPFDHALALLAAGNGFLDIIEYFVDRYPDVAGHQDDKSGLTPLMAAARCGHYVIVEYLHLVQPSSVTLLDKNNWSALMYAVSGGHIDSVEFLYHAHREAVRISDVNGMTPLMVAARYGHMDVVNFLYEREPSLVSAKDSDSRTALMHAAASGHVAVVQQLNELELRGDNFTSPRRMTAGYAAVKSASFVSNTLSSSSNKIPGKLVRAERLLATIDLA